MPKLFKTNIDGEKKEQIGGMPSIGQAGRFVGIDKSGNKIRTDVYTTRIDHNGFRKDKKIELDWEDLGVDRVLYFEHQGEQKFEAFILAKNEDVVTGDEKQRRLYFYNRRLGFLYSEKRLSEINRRLGLGFRV